MESTASAVELAATSVSTPLPAARALMATSCPVAPACSTAQLALTTEATNATNVPKDAEAATAPSTADHATPVSSFTWDHADLVVPQALSLSRTVSASLAVNHVPLVPDRQPTVSVVPTRSCSTATNAKQDALSEPTSTESSVLLALRLALLAKDLPTLAPNVLQACTLTEDNAHPAARQLWSMEFALASVPTAVSSAELPAKSAALLATPVPP